MKYRVEISLNKVDDNGEVGLISCYVTKHMDNINEAEQWYDQFVWVIQQEWRR